MHRSQLAQQIEQNLNADAYRHQLLHTPVFRSYREPAIVVWLSENRRISPVVTFVLPCFDHRDSISEVVGRILHYSTLPFDLIIIDDGSVDNTHQTLIDFLKGANLANSGRVLVLRNPTPIYETACDNQGFTLARTDPIVEVQADIWIEDPSFDIKLIAPLRDPRVSSVSGRFVHQYDLLLGRSAWLRYPIHRFRNHLFRRNAVGLIGQAIFDTSASVQFRDGYYMGETAARGPWALRRSDLLQNGYLDEAHFFLGNDDHDYHRRLYLSLGMLPVYCPLQIFSRQAAGATRRERSGVNAMVYADLKATHAGSPDFNHFLRTYVPFFDTRVFDVISTQDPDPQLPTSNASRAS